MAAIEKSNGGYRGAGIGVFSNFSLPIGVHFGPYRGKITEDIDSEFCWRIYSNTGLIRVVDAGDEEQSNWMRYVNCSRHWSEQNLIAYQYKGQIYYRTIKIIPKFTELLVFYGSEYASVLNVDLRSYNSPQVCSGNQYNGLSFLLPSSIHIQLEDDVSKYDGHFDNSDTLLVKEITKINNNKNQSQMSINSKDTERNNISNEFECGKVCSTKDIQSEQIHKCNNTTQTLENDNLLTKADIMSTQIRSEIYTCDICPFKTSQKRYIATHMKMHSTNKIFVCDICQYRCARKDHFNRHMRTHSSEKLDSWNISRHNSINKDGLIIHMASHTGEKPYACVICQYRSARKTGLNRHMRTHTGEKPYACEICQYLCTKRKYLKVHMQKHTG